MKKHVGNLLLSNPIINPDHLARSVLFVISHNEDTAIALQINKIQDNGNLATVATGLGIQYYNADPIWYGGNLAVDKIHIIHSLDWRGMNTIELTKHIGLTHDVSILAAMSQGNGPQYFKACAGYWLFNDGRLEQQLSKVINPNDPLKWEVLPATLENVFMIDPEEMWESCLQHSIIKNVKNYFSY